MSEKRTVWFYEFSPDGGDLWLPMCSHEGQRIFSSVETDDFRSLGIEYDRIRSTQNAIEFHGDIPMGFDDGVLGTQRRNPSGTNWLKDRTPIAVQFLPTPFGFFMGVISKEHMYYLRRMAISGEPIWRFVHDVMKWFQATLDAIDKRGLLGRRVDVQARTLEDKGELGLQSIGGEIELWELLHGWIARHGQDPWEDICGV